LECINLRLKQLVLVAFHELLHMGDMVLFDPFEFFFSGDDSLILREY
jgi:hypothetical protein